MLSGKEILRQIDLGAIEIDPVTPSNFNPNSVNLTLGPTLSWHDALVVDPRSRQQMVTEPIPPEGFVIAPGRVYLGTTVEAVHLRGVAGEIHGRSSFGRCGLGVQVTAGFIDDGFRGQITLELWSVGSVRVRAGDVLCQIAFDFVVGERTPYRGRYQGQAGPTACRLHKDFVPD